MSEEKPPTAPVEGAARRQELLLRFIPPAVFLMVPALLALPALGSEKFLFGADVVVVFYHLYGAVGQAIAEGRLPVWNPHVMCGTPLLAAMQGGVLYPPTWTAAILSPGAFWTLTVWAHLSLSGFFAYGWLRQGLGIGRWGSLVGAFVFMLSGFAVTHAFAGHVSFLCCYPWAVAVLWRLERLLSRGPTLKRAMLLAASLALMIVAGFPQLVMITGVALVLRMVHFIFEQREGRRLRLKVAVLAAGSLALGFLLAAPQLLPTLELVGQTQRSSINTFEFVTSESMPPANLITLFAPTFLGHEHGIPYWGKSMLWEVCGFVGVSGLALCALAAGGGHRQRRLWIGTALGSLVLAMGHYTPVYSLYCHLVPGATLFRVPARYLLLFTIACAPLAAMGFDRLWNGDDKLRRHALWIASGGAVLFLAALIGWMTVNSPTGVSLNFWRADASADGAGPGYQGTPASGSEESARSARTEAANSLALASLCLAGVIGALLACRWGRPGPRWIAAALGLLAGVELLVFTAPFFRSHPEEGMRWDAGFVSNVRGHPHFPFRIATSLRRLPPNLQEASIPAKCMLAGLDHVGGYDPMVLKRYSELLNVARGKQASRPIVSMFYADPCPLLDLLGARYWIVPGPPQLPPGWRGVGQLDANFVYENPAALPRAFFVNRAIVLKSDAERLDYLRSPAFDPRSVVVLESDPGTAPASESKSGAVVIRSWGPGRYDLQVGAEADGFVVLSEASYPGWTAEVDGAPATILRADHLLQAVAVPSGRHVVRFSYRSTYLMLGLVFSAAAAFLPLAVALAVRKAKRGAGLSKPDPTVQIPA